VETAVIRKVSRRLRDLVEPIAANVYFAPEAQAGYQAFDLGYIPSYFCSRGACMGQVPGEVIVAAFGVLNILIMAVLERVNDIAILRSFGLSRLDIAVIYVFQGLMVGLIGSTLGLILGKLSIEGLRRVKIPMEGLVKTEGLLMSEHASEYWLAFFSSMLIVLVAAAYPAWRAARYDPVEVIRGAH